MFTDTNLIGRYIELYADGVLLNVGLTGSFSYTYNIATGLITWNSPLAADTIITVFTYIPSLSGWTLFLDTTVGGGVIANGATTYTSASLIGTSIAVIVGGLLPVGLSGTLSYTFNSLTGQITFNQALTTGQVVKIYTY
jgi:homoserine dehydrogenase